MRKASRAGATFAIFPGTGLARSEKSKLRTGKSTCIDDRAVIVIPPMTTMMVTMVLMVVVVR